MKKFNICSLYFIKEISSMKIFLFLILSVTFIVNGFFISSVNAEEILTDYRVISGVDSTSVETVAFSEADIKSLSIIDADRIRNNGESWPKTGSYDESKYMEFLFGADVPSGSKINSVILKNNYRRDNSLPGAKLEIWNGSEYINQDIKICGGGIDCDEEIDITSYINTPDLVNNLTVRFLAYREGDANTKTSHDYIGLIVKYEEEVIIPAFYTEVIGDIEEDTYWTKDKSPYVVNEDLFITTGSTLYIGDGVVVKFAQGKTLMVDGKIEASGTVEFPIYFTSLQDDSLMGDSNGDRGATLPENNDWAYIFIDSPDAESILNNIIVKYSTLGLVLYNAGPTEVNGLISDKSITIINSNANFNRLNVRSVEIFENSNVVIDNSIIKNNNHYSISVYKNSKLTLNNSELYNESALIVIVFENSLANISGITVNGGGGYRQRVFSIYNNSELNINNSDIYNTYNGFEIFNTAKLIADNLDLSCSNEGIVSYNDSSIEVNNSSIGCLYTGIALYSNARANIHKSIITDAMNVGIYVYNNPITSEISITESEIVNNNYGFYVFDSNINVNGNSIHDNLSYGAFTFRPIDLDFTSNYWGDVSGPTHSSNSLGIGDVISDNILFNPFLEVDPLLKASLSNIMFIPGFQASRLYRMRDVLGSYEDKLWEPNASGDLPDMNMDLEGESINEVYTKDVIKSATVFGIEAGDYYKSFMDKLDNMVDEGDMNDWKAIPYDWRYSPIDVVNRGIEKDGKISYIENLSEDEIPYIISQLQELSETSKNGRVTIITHSNGGLVAKALIYKLEKMKLEGKSDLIDKIDNLITVVPPQLGTPAALVGVLHGYGQGVFYNILVGRKNARDLGQNSSGAYTLIPSERYIGDVNNSLITLEESVDKINNWRSKYGESIDTFEEFQKFLLDLERVSPSHDDLVNPTILNENIFNKANNFHQQNDDYEIPTSIKYYQIAGWGLPTAYSASYKSKNECDELLGLICSKKKFVLSSDIKFSSGGDKTVIAESSLYGNGEKYYLDLYNFNRSNPNNKQRSHADLFEVPQLFDLINNILRLNSDLPLYITYEKPSSVNYTIIKMRSPVAIDIYNEEGLHTGLIEGDNPEFNKIEENIPNSTYLEIGEEKYIVVPKEGEYELKLTGLSGGIFTLELQDIINNTEGDTLLFKDISTTDELRGEMQISSDTLLKLQIDNNNDGVFESELNPSDQSEKEEEKIEDDNKRSFGSIIQTRESSQEIELTEEKIAMTIKNNEEEVNLFNELQEKSNSVEEISKVDDFSNINNLSASVGFINENKIQLIIVGSLILLLVSIKYVFKLI